MTTIAVKQFCKYYNIPSSFIESLSSVELIEIIEIKNSKHVRINDIQQIEKMMRLHYDLNVNFEALDVINHLTSQIHSLQQELIELKNKIDFYQ
ncbi:chaperone modulator CbpM [uncultured Polaribacter sp.]|uniref:chaperone modulator CbpM n=1 Tax=uncultured Polaribacter sp. TaxID=174711 RepID=UPI00261AAB58|nr:chaperone modulator CbpM [uncultured Polaribacter sp.]